MWSSRPRRFPKQLSLPLAGLSAPPPLVWELLAPGEQIEAVVVLARLMDRVVQPVEEEEQHDDRSHP